MKAQGTPGLTTNPLLIQPGQTLQQANAMSTLQSAGTPIPHNVQVWTPSPSGPIGVSSLVPPRNSTNLVTLPPGQAVLMTNMVTTTNNPTMSMAVSSPMTRPQVHGSQMVHAGGTVVISSTASTMGDSIPSQLPTSTVIQGPNGPISVALSGGLLSSASVGSLTAAPTAYVSTNPGSLNPDSATHIPQFIDGSRTAQAHFATGTGFQNMVSSGPLVLDPNNIGISNPTTQTKLVGMTTVRSQTFVPPVSQQAVTRPFFPVSAPLDVNDSAVTFTSADLPQSETASTPTSTVVTVCSAESSNTIPSSPIPTAVSSPAFNSNSSTATTTPPVAVPPSTTQSSPIPTSANSPSNQTNQPSHDSSPTSKGSNELPVEPQPSAFTPSSLGQLMLDLDHQLQLDQDAQEVSSRSLMVVLPI